MFPTLPERVGERNVLTLAVGAALALMCMTMMGHAVVAELHRLNYGYAMWGAIVAGAFGIVGYFLPANRGTERRHGVLYGSAALFCGSVTLAVLIWFHRHGEQVNAVSFQTTKQLMLQYLYAVLIAVPYALLEHFVLQSQDDDHLA